MDPALSMPEGLQALPEVAWVASADGARFVGNARWRALSDAAAGECLLADWLQALHPDDRSAAAAAWSESIATSTPLEMSVKWCRGNDEFVSMLVRATPVPDSHGAIGHWIGIATAIDGLEARVAQAELVANELSHRIGNIFAVVGGMLALSARAQPQSADFARSAGDRIAALAGAHALIWPPTRGADEAPRSVSGLISLLLQPYATSDGPEIDVSGDDAAVGGGMATCITMIIHELATNAAKYGALSGGEGRLRVRLRRRATHLTIVWVEDGGPVIAAVPTRVGFGSAMITRLSRLGQVTQARYWWRRNGLLVALRFPIDAQSQ